jgi:hypothetical protein
VEDLMHPQSPPPVEDGFLSRLQHHTTGRRDFLKRTSAVMFVAAVAACDDNDITGGETGDVVIDLSDDFGVLNFAYALEQLEAAFYTKVASSFYGGATADEKAVLTAIRDHEVAHREFFKAALGTHAIGALTPNFAAVDFSDRTSVLTTSQTFENLGVGAYNGAGQYLQSDDFLTIAGKIVSVEARQAAAIQDLLTPKAFASGQIDSNGMDKALAPSAVIQAAAPFIATTVTLRNAPA